MGERKESNKIDSILPSLWNNGLLTDIECRIIAILKPLVKKQAAVSRIVMSKYGEEGAILKEKFKTVLTPIRNHTNSVVQNSEVEEPEDSSSLPEINPFLDNTIIKPLFGFLNLEDIKSCRLVCREWNSCAELLMRKRYAFHFQQNVVRPLTFYEFSKYSLPNLPVPAFKFSGTWCVSELRHFFEKWGKYIKEVQFSNIILKVEENSQKWIAHYDITPLLSNLQSLNSLKIERRESHSLTLLYVSLSKLPPIKTLSLVGSGVLSCENAVNRCAPSNIKLCNVTFKQDGKVLEDFCFNDFVDFRKARKIYLSNRNYCGRFHFNRPHRTALFNLAAQVFKTDQLHLDYVSVENWARAEGDIRYVHLEGCPYDEKSQLRIQALNFSNFEIDLSVLPKTVEKLEFASLKGVICREPIQLPSLNHLSIQAVYSNSCLPHFSNCANLIQLNLTSDDSFSPWKFNVDLVPKSVRKVKLMTPKIKFVNNDSSLKVDSLILAQYYKGYTNYEEITEKIQAKVLVVKCNSTDLDPSDIIKLVPVEKQPQKIILGFPNINFDSHRNSPFEQFEGSDLSRCVDKKSNFFHFENRQGKAITREEFENCI